MDPQLQQLKEMALDDTWGKWGADQPHWPNAIDKFIEYLEKTGRLLPPGGVERSQKGNRRGRGNPVQAMRIAGVGPSFPARYERTIITWPVVGEQEDNWPIFYGPWRHNPIMNNPNTYNPDNPLKQ